MKKIIYIILILTLIFSLYSCSNMENEKTEDILEELPNADINTEGDSVKENNTLVVYFSRTGNTKRLAEFAKEYYESDIYEIVPKIPYTDQDINYNDSNCRANIEQKDESVRPEIDGIFSDMSKYDTIILAYPIWWGEAPRIIDTFLESYDFSGKTIIPFCTSHSSGIGLSDTNLHMLVSNSVNWISGKRFSSNTDKESFLEWLNSVCPKDEFKEREDNISMRLYINNEEIPVTWENNDSVKELMKDVAKADIIVQMSMYSDNEQVGSLGRSYKSNNKQMTTSSCDIVLYNSSNIVLFYGSNSWSYTKLGRMNISSSDATKLLSNGNVTLKLSK